MNKKPPVSLDSLQVDLGETPVPPIPESVPAPIIAEGFRPLDLRHLNACDFSVIIGCFMTRLGLTETIIPDAERTCLDAPSGYSTVLACEIDPDTTDLRLRIHTVPSSEFRS